MSTKRPSGGESDAAGVEGCERDLETLAFEVNDVLARNAHVLEADHPVVERLEPHEAAARYNFDPGPGGHDEEAAGEVLEIRTGVAASPQRADVGSHGATRNGIDLDSVLFKHLQDADVGQSLGATGGESKSKPCDAGWHQAKRGSVACAPTSADSTKLTMTNPSLCSLFLQMVNHHHTR